MVIKKDKLELLLDAFMVHKLGLKVKSILNCIHFSHTIHKYYVDFGYSVASSCLQTIISISIQLRANKMILDGIFFSYVVSNDELEQYRGKI